MTIVTGMPDPKPRNLAELELTRAEAESPLWRRIQFAVAGHLQAKRIENDASDLTIAQTTALRGEIAVLKAIQALSREVGPESSAPGGNDSGVHTAGQLAGIPIES
jgi:hypothetical protein